VFAQTTHVVAAPHGFACVGIPATWLYISSFIEIRSGVSEPQGVKFWPFSVLWLFTFATACTTVQAVIVRLVFSGLFGSKDKLRLVVIGEKHLAKRNAFSSRTYDAS